jgi:uncharacterized protein YktA (UPF0223 family)
MAKKDVENSETEIASFIDRTDQKWYVKKGTRTIAFCDSVENFLEGKSDQFEFSTMMKSSKFIVNSKKEEVEKTDYFIFVLKDDSMTIVRNYNRIK